MMLLKGTLSSRDLAAKGNTAWASEPCTKEFGTATDLFSSDICEATHAAAFVNRQFEASEKRLQFVLEMNLREGMSEAAAAIASHAMFPPSFDLIAVLKMTGHWRQDGKLFYRGVRTTANRLSKDLGKLRKAGVLAHRGELMALKALDDYELLARTRDDPGGDMLAGWIERVRHMHRSMIQFGH